MTMVFRIEYKSFDGGRNSMDIGPGLYRSRRERGKTDAYRILPESDIHLLNPLPCEDKILCRHDLDLERRFIYFGFSSLIDLHCWVPNLEEHINVVSRFMHIVIYDVPKHKIYEGDCQVAFKGAGVKPLMSIPIKKAL